ncbi:MAG: GNAT family N-acetyltransferase [Propionibacteriales bacterium]|nr:GNAT family N-acetyltransferase [Propionibacteriales bacterium]
MQVRAATPDDIDEIIRLKALIMTTSYPFAVDLASRPDWAPRAAAVITHMMADDQHAFFVVDAPAGRLAGCVSGTVTLSVPGLDWGPWHANLGDMCTDVAYRGQGIGRALMDAALDWCRSKGAHTVRVQSTPGAVEVYERLGFARRDEELFPTLRLVLAD